MQSFLECHLPQLAVASCGGQVQQKVQAAVFALDLERFGSGASGEVLQQMVPLIAIIGTHAVDVALKITIFDKLCQRKLLKIRHCAGIKAQFCIKK